MPVVEKTRAHLYTCFLTVLRTLIVILYHTFTQKSTLRIHSAMILSANTRIEIEKNLKKEAEPSANSQPLTLLTKSSDERIFDWEAVFSSAWTPYLLLMLCSARSFPRTARTGQTNATVHSTPRQPWTGADSPLALVLNQKIKERSLRECSFSGERRK